MAGVLDRARAGILRRTLRSPFLRSIYRDREKRTRFLFLGSLLLNLILVIQLPEWLFYGAPLALGIPHLLASREFSGKLLSEPLKPNPIRVLFVLAVILTYLGFPGSRTIPVLLTGTLLGIGWGWKSGIRLSRLIPVLFLFWCGFAIFPLPAVLGVAIAHNFLAFWFWLRSAKTARGKQSATLALALTLLSVLWVWLLPESDASSIGTLLFGAILPSPPEALVRTFLLTQSLHYFIWLKAIPDAVAPSETPGGYALTLRRLFRNSGQVIPWLTLACAGILLSVFFHSGAEGFRTLYVTLAAYHGIFEIAAFLAILSIRAPEGVARST